jgi:hypothetical protein
MKLLIVLTLITSQCLFALISIAPIEIGENKGFNGKAAASFETKRGNTHKDNYKTALKLAYDNNTSYVTWAEFSGEYGETNDIVDTNKKFLHLRYIHALTEEVLRGELYGQVGEDEFRAITNRSLIGTGIRYKIFEIFKDGKGYFGIGGFYETIKYTTSDPYERNVRFNTYFAYKMKFAKSSKLAYTFYFQPKSDYLSDYITTQDIQLELNIYKQLFLNFQLSYFYDSKPAIDIEDYDLTQVTSFIFKF